MQALTFGGPGLINLAEIPDPVLAAPTDAVVHLTRAGLCGSDLHPYRGAEGCALGTVCGHEGVGVVTAVGSAVQGHAPGDRVLIPFSTSCGTCTACTAGLTSRCLTGRLLGWGPPDRPAERVDGCQAAAVAVPLADGTLVGIPAEISEDTAVLLTDNLPTAMYAVQRADVPARGRLAVVGLGAVGLCAVAVALALGAAEVLAIDVVPARRQAAERLGAVSADPDEASSAGVWDAAVDAAGPAKAQRLAASLVRPGGTVSVVAVQTAESFGIAPATAYDRNLTIRAGRAPVRAVLDRLLPMVLDGRVVPPTDLVVSHPGRPLAEGPALYAAAAAADGIIKATFNPLA